ncbi:MAG: YraN family protein [Candidatus Omnitrophica bacterium]|nr:YraN family protein [Candidatus Omnitrophota bacterium]
MNPALPKTLCKAIDMLGYAIKRKGWVKTKKLEMGHLGEVVAKRYLRGKGYRIIEENYRTKYAEIDLIASNKGILVFVEVRTRKDERFGSPEESLKRNKIKKLIRNAKAYVARKRYSNAYRIDAVCIVLNEDGGIERINHYENITF